MARGGLPAVMMAGGILFHAMALAVSIRARLETEGDKVADLHLWRLGPGHSGVIVSIVSDRPEAPEACKDRLAPMAGLSHVTVEVHPCTHGAAA